MNTDGVKIIVSLGPATRSKETLYLIKDRGVDLVRINMSHSTLEDLEYFIGLAKKVGIPFVLDTEGSQIRTGELAADTVHITEGAIINIHRDAVVGDQRHINLHPAAAVDQLVPGDIIHIDFNSLILRVSDISPLAKQGFITAAAITSGTLGQNKAVAVDTAMENSFRLPVLTEKDYQAIAIGLQEGVEYIAASFMRNELFVKEVRATTQGRMKIISKIECRDALERLEEIIKASDFLLIDRGDLSKEIAIEKIPLAQKIIMSLARKHAKGVFVATNLLESMLEKKQPTRAEAHDVIATILDGAYGLALAAETAIGKHPIACVNMINRLCQQAQLVRETKHYQKANDGITKDLLNMDYLLSNDYSSILVKPHGGKLIDRVMRDIPDEQYLQSLPKIILDQDRQMDVEQIAIGTFSPIEGFMGKKDFMGVLNDMRLKSGEVWTIPIILDVPQETAENLKIGADAALCDDDGPMAILHLEEKYEFDKDETNQKLYGTVSTEHPGVRWINGMNPVLLGGKIRLIRRRASEYKEYELTPRQVRRMFEERGWSRIVGFHTRNVIHRSHEFIQLEAMHRACADGLFVHPVIGKKKPGDFHAKYIIRAYEEMVKNFYPRDKVVFATFATFSRYAGPREAIFTALCRKNFGCSHFIVGRDHTGVGNFYSPKAAHEIFDKFDDLGIKPVRFDNVFYSDKLQSHVHEADDKNHSEEEKMQISGTQARQMFQAGEQPPAWFMRPEISNIILEATAQGEEVFVPTDSAAKRGFVLWFTGLSGSGKTTIAHHLKTTLEAEGKSVIIIDGDDVRENKHQHLGFSREDIKENNRLISELAKAKALQFDFVLVPIISPYAEDRARARSRVGERFLELFVNASLEACRTRDTKGLYKKAAAGEINNLIGFSPSNPYEAPTCPDIEIKTDELSLEDSVSAVLEILKAL